MKNKLTPKFIVCPLCNRKKPFCEDLQCDDCTHENTIVCGYVTTCKCFESDVILELHCQLIQSKIENSTLLEELYPIYECREHFKNKRRK